MMKKTPGKPKNRRRVELFWNLMAYALLSLIGVTMVLPLIWMISTALKTESAVAAFPPEFIPREQVLQDFGGKKCKLVEVNYQGEKLQGLELKIRKDKRTIHLLQGPRAGTDIVVPSPSVKYVKRTVWHWENFRDAWYAMTVKVFLFGRWRIKSAFSLFFLNSLYVAVCVTLGQVITSSLAAYAFAR